MSNLIQSVRGMNDCLPDAADTWQGFETIVRDWLRRYGYREMRTPILEHTGLFKRAIGEVTDIVEKEMYTFVDELNGESLALRPEGTASSVRAVIQHNLLYDGGKRLWYSGPMFRHERPQKGRYRQFHQVGVEALGFAGPDIDAELIVMCADLWRTLGIAHEGQRFLQHRENHVGAIERLHRHRAQVAPHIQNDKIVLIHGQPEQNVDMLRLDFQRPLRIFRGGQHAIVGQHLGHARGQKGSVQALDIARHVDQGGRRRPVGEEQRSVAELQVQVEQRHLLVVGGRQDVAEVGGDESGAAAALAGDEGQHLAFLARFAAPGRLLL